MRELVMRADYREHEDPLGEVLADHPQTSIKSIKHGITNGCCQKWEYAGGSPAGVKALRRRVESSCEWTPLLPTDRTDYRVSLLDQSDSHIVVFSRWTRARTAASVSGLAFDHFGPELLLETRRTAGTAKWHLSYGEYDQQRVSEFVAGVERLFGDTASVTLERSTSTVGRCSDLLFAHEELPAEQRSTLEVAIEHGYYETPRGISLEGLAKRVGTPRSTVSYRLRRAEAYLAERFVKSAPPFVSSSDLEEIPTAVHPLG